MGPYESCNLASINLTKFVKYDTFDWIGLGACVADVVRFLDNVVDVNTMPTPEITAANQATRRIGLGVMGWADALVALQIPYDSERALALADDLMGFIKNMASLASIQLAKERGSYGVAHNDQHRNAFRLCIAPTGTISIIAGVSSGIEPHFALEWDRTIEDGSVFKEQIPAYATWLLVAEQGPELVHFPNGETPPIIPNYFRTSHQISAEYHVRMQAAFQKHVDQAVSKTVNLPHDATEQDVRDAYLLAYQLGCAGITVYRDGSHADQVLVAADHTADDQPAEPDLGIVLDKLYFEEGLTKLQIQGLVARYIGSLEDALNGTETCRDCQGTLTYEEGCVTCHACGYSACA